MPGCVRPAARRSALFPIFVTRTAFRAFAKYAVADFMREQRILLPETVKIRSSWANPPDAAWMC
jgi:hypothetical protein